MKKPILIIFTLIIFSNVYAELPYDSLSVIAESGLIFREKPNPNSKVITTIPFGTKVRRYHDNWVPDTINGRSDNWMPVEYENKMGYVWGLYLSKHRFVETSDININYRILSEGYQCSQIAYSPYFNWYGVYKVPDSEIQELRRVKINIYLPKLLTIEELRSKFNGESIGEDGHYFLIETDQEEKSLFLFGSKEEIDSGTIEGFSFTGDTQESNKQPIFIYPEQPRTFKLANNYSVTFLSRDIPYIRDTSRLLLKTKYSLMLCLGDIKTAEKFDTKKTQNISDDLDYIGWSASKHSSRKNPIIIWYGDLDRDNKLDFIITGHNMVEHGGISVYKALFLSSQIDNSDIIRKVAEIYGWGCDG